MKTLTKILVCVFLLANLSAVKAETIQDFDGDGRTDFVVYRRNEANFDWYIYPSVSGAWYVNTFGLAGTDELTPADFDGDGRTDVAIWRRSHQIGQSAFYILNSATQTLRIEVMGEAGDEPRIVGDYDGDGKADPALYRNYRNPSTANKYIYRGSLNNPNGVNTTVLWGSGVNVFPYRGDFDGDGKLDFCLRNYSNATFVLSRSSDRGTEIVPLGLTNDYVASGDYDGDGKTDFCVARVGKSSWLNWHIKERDGGGTGLNPIMWGRTNEDFTNVFSGGDFDGDGRTDLGVYLVFTNEFRIRRSSNATTWSFFWGVIADNPIYNL